MYEMKPKPKAFIKPEYKGMRLPNPNPFNLPEKVALVNRNSAEFRLQTRALNDIARSKKASPISSNITY